MAQGDVTTHAGPDGCRLYNEDCIEGMRRHLDDGCVDVVVTSPPYNLGIEYSGYDDNIPREEYLEWTRHWASEVRRVLSRQGSFFLNVGGKPKDPWVPFDVLGVMRGLFRLQNTIHWVKSIAIRKKDVGDYPGITGDVSVGHYKPINSPRFLNDCHEYIFHLTLEGDVPLDRLALGVPYQDKSNVGRWKSAKSDLRCRGNTWFIPYRTIRSREDQRPHPATFPVQLAEMCMRLHGVGRIGLALDPFLGLGSSAIAAARLGVRFVGFEIDAEYFARACENLKAECAAPELPLT